MGDFILRLYNAFSFEAVSHCFAVLLELVYRYGCKIWLGKVRVLIVGI